MATNVIIKEGSGTNVIVIDSIINKITTNDATVNLEPNTFYELGSGTLQTLNLPTTDKDGDVIGIGGIGVGLFKIVQIAGQQILFGTTPTTIGVTGTLESTQINSVLYLRRLAAAGLYVASTPQGDFLVDGLTLNNAINNTVSGNSVTLGSTGATGESIVSSSFGPALSVKNIEAGDGVDITEVGGTLVFSATGGGLEIGYVQMISTTTTTGWTGLTFSFTAPAPITLLFKDFVVAGATYFTDNTANFIHTADGKLQYTGPTKLFSISAMYSTSTEENYAGAIAINGVQDTNSNIYIQDTTTVPVQFPKILNTNDIVSLVVARISAANRTVQSYSLKIIG